MVKRRHLISLVYQPIAQIPELTTDDLVEVLDHFPALRDVYRHVDSFHYALIHGTPEQLTEWVARAADCPFPKVASAAEGIRRDRKPQRMRWCSLTAMEPTNDRTPKSN